MICTLGKTNCAQSLWMRIVVAAAVVAVVVVPHSYYFQCPAADSMKAGDGVQDIECLNLSPPAIGPC